MNFRAFADELVKIGSPLTEQARAQLEKKNLLPVKSKPQESEKKAFAAGSLGRMLGPETSIGKHLLAHEHGYDLGGLGMLALPSAHNVAHQMSNARQGKDVDKKELAHSGIELAGLGTLGAPVLAQALKGKH